MIGSLVVHALGIGGGVAVAWILPRWLLGSAGLGAWLAGGGVVLLVGLVHEVLSRRWQAEELTVKLDAARLDLAKARREIDDLHADFERLRSTVSDGTTRNDNLLSEMRLMRNLLARLDPAKRAANAAAAPVPRDAPRRAEHPALRQERVLEITREALANNRVDLYLQPIVELPSRRVRYYEAFSRLRDENNVLVLPEQYLPVAVAAGLITTIDNLLLFRCVQMIKRAQRDRVAVGFFCNVSADSLADKEFFDQFLEYMESHRELARTLIFEFAQADLQRPAVRDALVPLRKLGFTFALDRMTNLAIDFAPLAALGFKTVKAEADRLLGELGRGAGPHLPEVVAGIARAGMTLIADKVEQEAAAERLARNGITVAQGYLFGEPKASGDGR